MRVTVHSTVGRLERDLTKISKTAPTRLRAVVRQGAIAGNTLAKDNARRTAGRHGKHYPNAFTWEMRPTYGYGGGNIYSAEYGPDGARPQGGMSFEWGSRNQPPHMDLNRSADVIGPSFGQEVGDAVDRMFW